MAEKQLFDAYASGKRDLRHADLENANLENADLRHADLRHANLENASLPSPTMFLLARWGEVSKPLCALLMRYDASNHDDPEKFKEWVNGGDCPYTQEKYQRCANFEAHKKLYDENAPLLSARQLMQCLLFEKCVYYMSKAERESYVSA